jgi:tRNA(fMet)-specific endonuclease VapC
MFILDTDITSLLQRGNEKVIKRLALAKDYEFGVTIITKVEVLRGRYDFLLKAGNSESLEKAQRYLIDSENMLAQLLTVYFDLESFSIFDEFRQNSKYRKIGRADMLIASICLANRAVLVTRNVKHFKQFPNLNVENWVD